MSDKGGLKTRPPQGTFPKKDNRNNDKEINQMERNGKRRGLGFQDTVKHDSKLMHKTIQKKHLVTQNKKPQKKNVRKSRDNDDQEADKEEEISDDEPSKYSMFKKKI